MKHVVKKVKQNINITQDMNTSYASRKRNHKEFKIGDHVSLMVKPRKISLRSETCTKMAPWFCGSFEILYRVGPIEYQQAFSSHIKGYNVFLCAIIKEICSI